MVNILLIIIWLVSFKPSEKWWTLIVSWDDENSIPNWMETHKVLSRATRRQAQNLDVTSKIPWWSIDFYHDSLGVSLQKGQKGLNRTFECSLSLFSWVLTCFDMFWHVLTCFDMFWHVLTCFDMFWHVLTFRSRLRGTIFWGVSGNIYIYI